MSGSEKRSLSTGEQSGTRKSKRIRDVQEQSGGQQGPETLPELPPFDIPDDMNAIKPEDVLTCSKAFSKEIYTQDLWAIFSTAVNTGRPNHITMHQPHKVLRIVLTIEKMIEKASEPALVEHLQTLHLDYIMLMCLIHTDMDKPNAYFPAHEEQFNNLVECLGGGQGEGLEVQAADNPKPPVSGFIVPPAQRIQFENLRVDASKVVPMQQISGYEDAKQELKAAVFIPTRVPHFASHGIGSNGILLYGPPGTGKTLLAMSTATLDAKCACFKVSSSDLIVKWVGESERNVASMFAIAAEHTPAIIIIDEVESLCQNRQSESATDGSARRVANTFLEKMTQYDNVCVIGTTNLPWQLDPAFVRRFQDKIHVGLPPSAVRRDIIRQRLQAFHHGLSNGDIAVLAECCKDFTGDAIVVLINEVIKRLAMELMSATHFRKVSVNGQDLFCPCEPKDGGIKRTFESFEERGEVHLTTTRRLTLAMLEEAAEGSKSQVRQSRADDEKTWNWGKVHFYR